MKLLFLGDIVGKSGREAVKRHLPGLIDKYGFDFTVVNAENAAGGFGVNKKICHTLFDCGVDAITLGNHAFDNDDIYKFIDSEPRLIRPCNYPKGTPGRGASVLTGPQGHRVLVINTMGRVFMPPLDCPFSAVEAQIGDAPLGDAFDAILIDVHAEASSEKQSFGFHFDGRATLVVGTHTHVPTADYRILPGGTAYQTDAGMCGDYHSIIGMQPQEPLNRFLTGIRSGRHEPATGEGSVCGVGVETDPETGLAKKIFPIRKGGALSASAETP